MGVRERRDVSQLDVAKAIGVSGAAVSQWENDERVPRDETLFLKLAAYLGVEPGVLRYGNRVYTSHPDPEPDVQPVRRVAEPRPRRGKAGGER